MAAVRAYAHAIDEDDLEAQVRVKQAHYRDAAARADLARERGDAGFFLQCFQQARQIASLMHALGADAEAVQRWLGRAADHAESALECGAVLSPWLYLNMFGVALFAERATLRRTLEEMVRPDFTDPKVACDAIFYDVADSLRHLSADRADEARLAVAACAARLAAPDLLSDVREVFEGYIEVITGLLASDQGRVERGFKACHEEYARSYAADLGIDAAGLLDVIGAGLLVMATEREHAVTHTSVYLPALA